MHKAALAACDANDAVKDGIITNPPACKFDPGVLQCKDGDAPDCLTAPQVAALRAVYAGPKNPRTGKQIYPGLSVGSEQQMPVLTMGKEPFPVATTFFRGLVFNDPTWDFRSFDYDHDVDRAMAYGHDALDVPPTGLDQFFAATPQAAAVAWLVRRTDTVAVDGQFLRGVSARTSARAKRRRAAVHGAGHGSLRRWQRSVEHRLPGRDRQLGRDRQGAGAAHRQQPAAAQPRARGRCARIRKVAKYSGSGSTDDEKNFRCDAP